MTVTCCICGAQVSKRKSLEVPGKGRACRHHDEAKAALADKQDDEAAKRKAEREPKPKRQREYRPYLTDRPRCYGCGDEGFFRQEAAQAMLVAMRRVERDGFREGESFFDAMDRARELTNLEGVALARVPFGEQAKRAVRGPQREICETAGATILCQKCAEKVGIDFKAAFSPPIEMNTKALNMMCVVAEMVKTDLDKIIDEEDAQREEG